MSPRPQVTGSAQEVPAPPNTSQDYRRAEELLCLIWLEGKELNSPFGRAVFHAVNGLVAAWWELAGLGDNEEESWHVEGLLIYLPAWAHFGWIPKVFCAITRGRNWHFSSQSLSLSCDDEMPGALKLK